MGNVLGRLDPKTGVMKEFPLRRRVGPARSDRGQGRQHLVHGQIGAGSSASWIRRPARSSSTRCPIRLPATRIRRCSTRTACSGSVCKRQHDRPADPQTGEIKLVTMPTPRSLPYGVVIDSKGVPFVVQFGTNKSRATRPGHDGGS